MEPKYDVGDTMIIYLNGKPKMAKVFGLDIQQDPAPPGYEAPPPLVKYHVTLIEDQSFVVDIDGQIRSTY